MTPREQWHVGVGWVISALAVAVVVWLVYFVIEVTRTLNVWPA